MRKGLLAIICLAAAVSCGPKSRVIHKDGYNLIEQRGGRTLGYSPASGVRILKVDGFSFKDLNRNGVLDPYEDWRLDVGTRAADLASQLPIEKIAGLMLYSMHQAVPTDSVGFWSSTYNGTTLDRSHLPHSAISDKQKKFLLEDNLRAVLVVRVESPRISAEWSNNLQAYTESLDFGIPVNISSDPRHETKAWAEFNAGAGGNISLWPISLGLAATFDPALVREFGETASREYRALGIATALSPQIDLATEPRWNRFGGTFGEDCRLGADMARAYVDGFQTSKGKDEISDGWGYASVNCMVKHWPGGGPEEGGRDAHYSYGKYSVFPGNNLDYQLTPFIEGAFKLSGKTSFASAVMPYYTISYGIDPSEQQVGNGYSEYIVGELLRKKYGYDGVVCTDWAITHDYYKVEEADGKCWGVETLTEGERHFKALLAGVDQFGGNNDKGPVLEAYGMWVEAFGEKSARARFESSARRLLANIFRAGLFENPYLDPSETESLVGCPKYMDKGYEAQLKSIVMLKNHAGQLPEKSRRKVYLPAVENGIDPALVANYFEVVSKPEEADFGFAVIEEPKGGVGYSVEDREAGGNGYMPVSLQYGPYTATEARETSIAGGDPLEKSANRSYRGKTFTSSNADVATAVRYAKEALGEKPLVVAVMASRPFVPAEIEPYADALLVGFGVQHQAFLDIVSGKAKPSAMLPMQFPASMATVEHQMEDVAFDMECYRDSDGNVYDFAYGLNWKGQIHDARYKKYARPIRITQADALLNVLPGMPVGKMADDTIRVALGENALLQFVVDVADSVSGLEASVEMEGGLPQSVGWIHNVRSSNRYVPGDPDSLYSPSGLYPDPIVLETAENVPAGGRALLSVDIPIPDDFDPGIYKGKVVLRGVSHSPSIKPRAIEAEAEFIIRVYNVTLWGQSMLVTNWYFPEKFSYMNNGKEPEPYGEEYWECMRSLLQTAADHGQNVWSVKESGTPVIGEDGKISYDFTKMDRMVEFIMDNVRDVRLLESNHIATRANNKWADQFLVEVPVVRDGAVVLEMLAPEADETREYISTYFSALQKHLTENRLADGRSWLDIWVQHIADEPVPENIRSWESIAAQVKAAAPDIRILEAYRSHENNPELLDIPVPQMDEILWPEYGRLTASQQCWFYTCMYPRGSFANRYVTQPLIKTRLIHWINARYDIPGYLHWGFNYWGENGDPYGDASAPVNDWPGGDAYIVYPSYHRVNPSIRLKAMRDGIRDYELLKIVKEKTVQDFSTELILDLDRYDLSITHFRELRKKLLEIAEED